MCSASREICCAVNFIQQTRRRVCEQRFHRSAVATLDVPQEQKEEDKKMPLLLTDPQSQVFGDEEESGIYMQPLPSQITLK